MDRPAKNEAKDEKARGDFSRVLFLSQRFVFFGARKAGGVLPTEGGERGASLAPHSANGSASGGPLSVGRLGGQQGSTAEQRPAIFADCRPFYIRETSEPSIQN